MTMTSCPKLIGQNYSHDHIQSQGGQGLPTEFGEGVEEECLVRIHKTKWSEVAQSCPTLCNPMDCSPPGSSIHGVFQARVLEWVAISFSRGSSQPWRTNPGLPHRGQTLYRLSHKSLHQLFNQHFLSNQHGMRYSGWYLIILRSLSCELRSLQQ